MALSKIQTGLVDSQTNLTLTTPTLYVGGSGSANLFNDYEEGTFNIAVNVGGTDSDPLSMKYVKIGRMVQVDFQSSSSEQGGVWGPSSLTNAGSGTDIAISTTAGLGQLPFTPAYTGHSPVCSIRSIRTRSGTNLTTGERPVLCWKGGVTQLYMGALRDTDNRYTAYNAVNNGDTGATWEKTNTQSDIKFACTFTYYTND